MNIYFVRLYPFDSSDSAEWFFATREEADAFAKWVADNASDPDWVGGGRDIIPYACEVKTLTEAIEDATQNYNIVEEGDVEIL